MRVLPVPAPATTISGPPGWVTAARWERLRPSGAGRPCRLLARGPGHACRIGRRALRSLSPDDWLAVARRAAAAARDAVLGYAAGAERAVQTGRGEGGDMALVIDRAAEDAVFAELEAFGAPVTAVSEERGEAELNGGGEVRVVIDPVDGSLNAKRGLPFACVSIAVGERRADGRRRGRRGDRARAPAREWWALRGGGAFLDGERLAQLEPGQRAARARDRPAGDRRRRGGGDRGSRGGARARARLVAVTLCLVAAGQLDRWSACARSAR